MTKKGGCEKFRYFCKIETKFADRILYQLSPSRQLRNASLLRAETSGSGKPKDFHLN